MNHHVPHRHRRETVAQSEPVLASVDGDERPVLGSDEQEVTVDSILSDDSDRYPGRKTSTDGFPGSAVVPRAKKINAKIVVPVIIEGRIGGGDIEMRCLQGADPRARRSPGVRGKSGNPGGYVRPELPPSRLMCRFPSSVPAQSTADPRGDAAMAVIVAPSPVSRLGRPLDRSGLTAVQLSPRSSVSRASERRDKASRNRAGT